MVVLLGVVGVLGTGDCKLFFGEVLDVAAALAVDIAAGLLDTLLPADFSLGLEAVAFVSPFVPAGFSMVLLAADLTTSFSFADPLCIAIFLSDACGLSIDDSAVVSSARELRCRLPISGRIFCLVSDVSLELSPSILKLLLRLDVLGSPLVSLRNPSWLPFLSTATKLVRTLERGRGEVPVLAPPRGISCRQAWSFGKELTSRTCARRTPSVFGSFCRFLEHRSQVVNTRHVEGM